MASGGGALRKSRTDGLEQIYSADLIFNSERWQLDFAGTFRENQNDIQDLANDDRDALIEASISTSILPTLPMLQALPR